MKVYSKHIPRLSIAFLFIGQKKNKQKTNYYDWIIFFIFFVCHYRINYFSRSFFNVSFTVLAFAFFNESIFACAFNRFLN